MIADTEKIKWLLDNRTQYFISKNTNVSQPSLSKFINGQRNILNMTLDTAIKLTKLSIQEQQNENTTE